MIVGIQKRNKNILIQDNDKFIEFDMIGRAVTLNPVVTPADLGNKQFYKAISVLSSNGEVHVGVFDTENTFRDGTLNTMIDLSMKRGYFKRLMLSGTDNGISYTQTIFLYTKETDLGEFVKCI